MKSPLAFGILVLCATASFAQMNDMMKGLNAFVGTWKCTGTAFASPSGPEHPTKATVTAKWTLNNHWLEMRYIEAKTSKNANPTTAVLFLGYDPEATKVAVGVIDNMGGYATETSAGWEGDQMVLAGPAHVGGMTVQVRDTFVRKGKSEITHLGEMQDKAGNWQKLDQETCKR